MAQNAENLEFELIPSSRGGRLLAMGGHLYQKKRENATHMYWYCSRRDLENCRGAVKTLITMEQPQVTREHNHIPDRRRVNVAKANNEVRTAASTSHDKPAQIRNHVLANMEQDSREELGSGEAVRKMVKRKRYTEHPPNVLPDQLRLDGIWTTTRDENPQPFLVRDNENDRERVIVYSSPDCLRHTAAADKWFMDGNFSIAPLGFSQLYIIRVPLGETAITTVYAILQRKTQRSYGEVLQAVSDACDNAGFNRPQPANIHCDFELAVHQAVRQHLPQAEIRGCFYHLTQSTWRKIQELGLTERYKAEEDVRQFTGMVDGLAFLPVEDVGRGLNYIRNNTPQGLDDLVDYMDTIYINGVRQVRMDGRRMVVHVARQPLFPPRTWNVYEQTLAGGQRTNNFCESWNMRVKTLVGMAHPTIWRLLEVIKEEDVASRTTLTQYMRGQLPQKRVRRETRRYNRRLSNLAAEYANQQRGLEDYLRAIGHNIRFGVERLQE